MHQRREVPGRAKDFDVLVAELKASSRKGESPKEKSPAHKEPALERPSQEPPTAVQGVAATEMVIPNSKDFKCVFLPHISRLQVDHPTSN